MNNRCLLRPNTFYLLLQRAGKPELGQSTGWGKSNGMKESSLMADLICVADSKFEIKNKGTLESYMSGFKSGNPKFANSKTYFPFAEPAYRGSFSKTMANDYQGAIDRLKGLVKDYLNITSGSNKELLVGGLMELLEDASTDYIFDFGFCQKPVSEFASVNKIAFYPFILSVWYYVVMNTPDSTEATFFDCHVGETIASQIEVTLDLEPEQQSSSTPDSKEEPPAKKEAESSDSEFVDEPEIVEPVPQQPAGTPQMVFNFNAPVGEFNAHVDCINKNTYNYYGVKPEERHE